MIPNLRDVGETINILHGEEIMKEGVFFRGGTVNELFDKTELPLVKCILNLRNGEDRNFDKIEQLHIPRTYTNEVYETRNGNVRNWLNEAISSLGGQDRFPLLVHCTGGKDRTGVFVAMVLTAIGISAPHIEQDYLLSEKDVDIQLIKIAIEGFGNINEYIYKNSIITSLKSQLTRPSI